MRASQALGLLKQSAIKWYSDKAPQLAAAIAYYSIFSIAPLLIIAISVSSLFLGEKAAQGKIVHEISRYVGETGARAIESMVASARNTKHGGLLPSIISLVVLILGASGAFGQLESALNQIWGVPPRKSGGITAVVKERTIGVLMV